MPKNVVIIGAGGHAKVIADIIVKSDDNVVGFIDDALKIGNEILGFPVLGKISDIHKFKANEFIIGIGNNYIRKKIAEKYANLNYYTALHPTAVIGIDTTIQEGTCVMAKAVINVSSKIGKHCIINTGSIVEHDNVISDYVHISPNATLCGTVKVESLTHIGASACVKNNVSICGDVVVGLGGVVVKDLKKKGTYIGVPVRRAK